MVEANASALEVLRGGKGLCDRDGVLRARLAADDDRLAPEIFCQCHVLDFP